MQCELLKKEYVNSSSKSLVRVIKKNYYYFIKKKAAVCDQYVKNLFFASIFT